MVSKFTSLNSDCQTAGFPAVVKGHSFFQNLISWIFVFILLTLTWSNANAQCTVMVNNPNVDITVAGSTATLDAAAVAANITIGGGAGCTIYTFYDALGNPFPPGPVVLNCDGTTPGPGTYFLTIGDGMPVNESNQVQLSVTLNDVTDPSFTTPIDLTIRCDQNKDDLSITGDVTDEMDNCATGIQATYTDDLSGLTGCNNTGTITRTWTLDDGNGNSVSDMQTITVQDVTPPTFTPPANITISCNDDINDLTITGDVTDEADNCSTGLMATHMDAALVPGMCPNTGTVTRTWTLVDDCSNATNFMQSITIADMSAPVSTQGNIVVDNDAGVCNAAVTLMLTAANTSDVCDDFTDLTITNDFNAGGANASDTYPSGVTTNVTFTITDRCGNVTMHTVGVTVNDTLKPIIMACPADVTLNADVSDCDNTYSWSAPYAVTACSGSPVNGVLFSNDPNVLVNMGSGTPGPAPGGRVDFADFPVGTTTIGYAFTDLFGNQDTCEFKITVLDNQPPVINCPPDQTLNFGSCTPPASLLVPNYTGLSSVSDNCASGYTVLQSPAANSLLSAVTTLTDGDMFVVRMIARDNSANNLADTCYFNVTLSDTNVPVPNVSGSALPSENSTCGALELCAPTATNNCGGLVVGTIVPSIPAGVTVVGTCSAPCSPNPSITGTPGSALNDNSSTVINIPVSGLGSIVDEVEFSLDITHTWVGDLTATLTSPSGTVVQLFDQPGFPASAFGCDQNNINVTFSDGAANTAANFENTCNASAGPGTYAIQGTFQATGSLAAFSGDNTNGNWVLTISDGAAGDIGVLESFSLDLCTLSGATIPLYSYNPGTYNLTWEYDDGNGNTASQTQIINVANDTQAPVINCADITVELDDNGMATVFPGALAGESVTLVSGGNISFAPGSNDYCITLGAATTISFSWNYNSADISALWDPFGYVLNGVFTPLATSTLVSDPASLQQSGLTTLSLNAGDQFCFRASTADNIPPNATTVVTNFSPGFTGAFDPANWTNVNTNSNGSATYSNADVTDNCGVDFSTLSIDGQASWNVSCGDLGVNSVNITIDDINGNTGSCIANITVIDQTPPTLSGVPADNTISCADPIVVPTVTANDVCDGALNVVLNETSTKTGNPATCGNYNYTITRVWTATDNSGNSTVASQTLNVEDNSAPTNPVYSDNLVGGSIGSDPFNCNANVTLALTSLTDCAPFANLTITNDSPFANSGGADASGTYPVGSHNVNFTVSDPCGNTISYNRAFTVVDDDAPIASCKGALTVGLPASGTLILSPAFVNNGSFDNCGTIVSMTVSPNTFDCDDADGVTPHNITLTVVDDAGNSASCNTTVVIQDNHDPVAVCQDITINLDQSGNASITPADIDGGSSDNCTATGDLIYSISQSTFGTGDLGNTVPVNLTVEDSNGNTSTCTANVFVDIPVTCFDVGTAFGATGTVVSVPVTVENFINVLNFQFSVLMSTPTTGQFVGISSNVLPPNTIANVLSNDTLNISWGNTSTPAELTLSDGTVIFNIDILLTGNVGNTSVVSIIDDVTSLPLQLIYNYGSGPAEMEPCTDPGAIAINAPAALTVAGEITTENGSATANVDVSLTNNGPVTLFSTTTVSPGDFSFNPVNAGMDVKVIPSKTTGWTSGVTANDLFQIQRHIVGLDTLSNFRKVAADARKDGQINGFDVVDLQILLGSLGTVTPPTNTSWVFAAKKDPLPTLMPLFVPPYTDCLLINNLPSDSLQNDFTAIKTGDVTGDANPLGIVGNIHAFSRSNESVKVIVADQAITADEEFSLELSSKDFKDLVAYQWVLKFDPEMVSFVGYDKGALSNLQDANFGQYHLDRGLLALIWHQVEAAQYSEEDVLFTLRFKALKDAASIRNLFQLDQNELMAGAWKENGLPLNVELEFSNETQTDFQLLQNQPNPFKDETVIGFYLPKATNAKLQILDVSGRLIKQIEGTYAAGYHEVNISRSELSAGGVLYYRLETADNVATKNMIIVE